MTFAHLKYYFLVIFLLVSIIAMSQNLVYNGSFEVRESIYDQYHNLWSDCPYNADHFDFFQLAKAKGWSNPNGPYSFYINGGTLISLHSTSDFFHNCSCNPDEIPTWVPLCEVSTPRSVWYRNYQYPRTGEGYAGSIMILKWGADFSVDNGEYIKSKLITTPIKDSIYRLRFYINKSNGCSYSAKSQGALLSATSYSYGNLIKGIMDSTLIPQVLNPYGYITDTINWVKIEKDIILDGTEMYIIIGSFDIGKDNGRYEYHSAYEFKASYLIDDISLYPISAPIDSARCGPDTLICLGNKLRLGKSNIKSEYKSEYSFEWFVLGREDSVFSNKEHPEVSPDTTTTYIVKVIDFKFDKSTDTVIVNVIDCSEPTKLTVYPNPTYDLVNFRFNSPIPHDMKIEIYDVSGRLILQRSYSQNYEKKELQINMSLLASGMYFYSVLIDNEIRFKGKIIHIK